MRTEAGSEHSRNSVRKHHRKKPLRAAVPMTVGRAFEYPDALLRLDNARTGNIPLALQRRKGETPKPGGLRV
jgi:hypothetical protein